MAVQRLAFLVVHDPDGEVGLTDAAFQGGRNPLAEAHRGRQPGTWQRIADSDIEMNGALGHGVSVQLSRHIARVG